MEFTLFETLKEAYETSTLSLNRFKTAIDRIKWDTVFNADGETYYCKGGFSLTIENINPFKESWKPTCIFSDGSMIQF